MPDDHDLIRNRLPRLPSAGAVLDRPADGWPDHVRRDFFDRRRGRSSESHIGVAPFTRLIRDALPVRSGSVASTRGEAAATAGVTHGSMAEAVSEAGGGEAAWGADAATHIRRTSVRPSPPGEASTKDGQ